MLVILSTNPNAWQVLGSRTTRFRKPN